MEERRRRTEHIRKRHTEAHAASKSPSLNPDRTPPPIVPLDHQKSSDKKKSNRTVLLLLLAFRCYNALVIKTFHVPDEYWQSLEVAHHMVFGYGYQTWEWVEHIRGYAHPLLFAASYKLLEVFGIDNTDMIIYLPRLIQGALAALGDWYVFALALRLFGPRAAKLALVVQLLSWWNFFAATRTLANSAEAVMTAAAMAHWPWESNQTGIYWNASYRRSLTWAALSCVLRPTNAIIWLFMGLRLLQGNPHRFKDIVVNTAGIMFASVTFMVTIDRIFYGTWVFTPLEFLNFNVTRGVSIFYGAHPWHWYITQGFPLVTFTALPFFGIGIARDARVRPLAWLVLWVIFAYSLLAHKEFRFLYPLLPVVMAGAGAGLAYLEQDEILDTGADRSQVKSDTPASQPEKDKKRKRSIRLALSFLAVTNCVPAYYTTRVHQRGVLDVMDFLRHEARNPESKSPIESIGFLMPCHSTPYYSHLHKNIPMWFLTCEPPLSAEIMDEADLFYKDPHRFLEERFEPIPVRKTTNIPRQVRKETNLYQWPSHLVIFEALLRDLGDVLERSAYRECARFFNSHFHDDSRRKGDVIVYCVEN